MLLQKSAKQLLLQLTKKQLHNNHHHNYVTSAHPKKVVAILGGGITGLTTAYYLVKKYGDKVHPIVLEKSDRFGGWVKTVTTDQGSRFEMGPRTIRPAGLSGLNTLDLVEELGLQDQVLFVEKNHPTAKNRFVYVNGKLCRLPTDGKVLVKAQAPFTKPLVFAGLRDLLMFRVRKDDDSIHNFVKRRFGSEVANYLIDPLIRGICAGDSHEISVKFLMKGLYEYEQKYGSVLVGMLMDRLRRKPQECNLTEDQRTIGFSKIALSSPYWAVWTLENGLEELVKALEKNLLDNGVQLRKNTNVTSIRMDKHVNELEIEFQYSEDPRKKDEMICNHVISCVHGDTLAKILRHSKPSHPEVWSVLLTKLNVDLQVTALTFDNPELIRHNGFGFLVPSTEKNVEGLLGVVFDTNSFPQPQNKTVLTVMSRDSHGGETQGLDKIMWYLDKTLGIKDEPCEHYSELLRNCIPQYSVGHYEKIGAVQRYLDASNLPLSVAGASWGGISVNDCVLSGRNAAVKFETFYKKFKLATRQSLKS